MPTDSSGNKVTIRVEAYVHELLDCMNPKNWKDHPKRQREYLGESIGTKHGWVGNPILNAMTMKFINGHGRFQTAVERGWETIPLEVGVWSEEEEEELLIFIDNSSHMSSVKGNKLKSVTESVLQRAADSNAKKRSAFTRATADIHSYASDIANRSKRALLIHQSKKSLAKILNEETTPKVDKRETSSNNDSLYDTTIRDDVIFPGDERYELPKLLSSRLFKDVSRLPSETFARKGSTLFDHYYYCQSGRPFDSENHAKPIGGVLGFFTEDNVIERVYKRIEHHAQKLVDEKWWGIVEPDFSTYYEWPFAQRLWSVYKSRYLSRYWQQLDIPIIPLIRRTNDPDKDRPWLYDTLPPEMNIAAMQLRMGGVKQRDNPEYWKAIGRSLHIVKEMTKLEHVMFHAEPSYEVYVKPKIPKGVEYRFITPYQVERRNNFVKSFSSEESKSTKDNLKVRGKKTL